MSEKIHSINKQVLLYAIRSVVDRMGGGTTNDYTATFLLSTRFSDLRSASPSSRPSVLVYCSPTPFSFIIRPGHLMEDQAVVWRGERYDAICRATSPKAHCMIIASMTINNNTCSAK